VPFVIGGRDLHHGQARRCHMNRRRLRKHRTFGYLTPAETRQRHQHALAP
jgi:hypothetical protein